MRRVRLTGASRKGMLAVLEQAQASGQKAQQDEQIGQGSIFDSFGDGNAGGAAPVVAPRHAPIPSAEFDRTELLAAEKESIGLFVSAHPLKELSAAMTAATDCSLGAVGERRDGDWVTVGGIISQAKKLRTKKGDMMMFATLDDLEGSVELVVFAKTLEESGEALVNDAIVLVRGRVDHKDQARTCVVVQKVDRFEPTAEEVDVGDGAGGGGAPRQPEGRCGSGSTRPRCRSRRSVTSRTCWPASPESRMW